MSLLLLGCGSAGAFRPTQISGLVAWYDASQETVADGTAIATIVNRAAPGTHDATQATGANQPLLKTNIQNGRSVYRFDGVNDAALAASFGLVQPLTHFAVARVAAINGVNHQGILGGSVNADDGCLNIQAGGTIPFIYAGTAIVSSGVAWGTVNFHRIAAIINGASSMIYQDADTVGVTGNPGANGPNGLAISGGGNAGRVFNGDIGELLTYSKAVSAAERAQIMDYLQTKWGTS